MTFIVPSLVPKRRCQNVGVAREVTSILRSCHLKGDFVGNRLDLDVEVIRHDGGFLVNGIWHLTILSTVSATSRAVLG